ncbi:MAG TPA: Hsp20/alpha crystallin family protein [Candidatus Limnocylindrales bacterium]|jgi:HSP20 family protein|nr:Hsp20/alpha crystallin family protein [Candidatus Limnocylindrales bacterium]
MTMIRRAPDRSMPLRSAIERLMGEWPAFQFDPSLTELAPPIDVRETTDSYVVEIDLPGVDPENTEVLVEGRTVTIRGQFEESREEDQGNFLLRERRRGSFMRAVALPGMVDVDQVSSSFENGQLTIVLPKASQNRARRIQIEAGKRQGNGNGRTSSARSRSEREKSGSEAAEQG